MFLSSKLVSIHTVLSERDLDSCNSWNTYAQNNEKIHL